MIMANAQNCDHGFYDSVIFMTDAIAIPHPAPVSLSDKLCSCVEQQKPRMANWQQPRNLPPLQTLQQRCIS